MGREIKFRAWNGEKIIHQFVVYGRYAECLNIMTDEDFATQTYSVKAWKPMQFTGLKTKSGEDIYEGDILLNDEGNMHVMGFRRGCFTNVKSKYKSRDWQDIMEYDTLYSPDCSEVIGNIYENPELLKNA